LKQHATFVKVFAFYSQFDSSREAVELGYAIQYASGRSNYAKLPLLKHNSLLSPSLCEKASIMPSRSRPPPEVEDDSGLRSLSFDEPLSWRVGRAAIPIADLLERLQTLAQELRKLDQEEIDKESLRKVSQELASGNLLAHKDKGVRAWATCCIVDVLRLCAPDAPFTRNQLKVWQLTRNRVCKCSVHIGFLTCAN
jgi:hypothetical protein